MFNRTDNSQTKHRQLADNDNDNVSIDEVIESKIKECQRENGECMKSTSRRLKEQYGISIVDTVIHRLNKRRARGNTYQQNESSKILDIISQLTKTSDRTTTQSSNSMSL